jgi:hypothetical protein
MPEDLGSGKSFWNWTVELHDRVNAKLGHPLRADEFRRV